MAKYYLKNPKNHNDILIKRGQAGDQPIYKAKQGNEHFHLSMDGEGHRWLVEIDGSTQKRVGTPTFVPDDWRGEPDAITIERSTYDNLLDLCDRGDPSAERVWDTLVRRIIEGDKVTITEDGYPVERIVVQRRRGEIQIVTRPLSPPQ